jgi:hypothetical protein
MLTQAALKVVGMSTVIATIFTALKDIDPIAHFEPVKTKSPDLQKKAGLLLIGSPVQMKLGTGNRLLLFNGLR